MTPEEMIGQRVRAIRETREMTQEEFGLELGRWLKRTWPRQAVSGAERGERAFTGAELVAIAHVLDIWVGALFMPPIDVDELDMPSGERLSRALVERVALAPENLSPIATEAIRRAAVHLGEALASGAVELHALREAYEVATVGKYARAS